ncbi:hypothetical protein CVS40_4869 [Lucilia cuprina]|nr:hypothetical protein CVS40_4869 [Lucilia cuprina]
MSSKRSYKRAVNKERARLNEILKSNSQQMPDEPACSSQQEADSYDFDVESPLTLREKLKNWFVQYSPSVKCCNSLLKILKEENMDVPSSVGGLIKREDECVVRTVAPGKYIHIGLEIQLQKIKKLLLQHSTDELLLDIGIDGIPLFKSSAIGLWPILAKIEDEPQVDVFIIGTYIENHEILTAQLARIQNHNELFMNTLSENTVAIRNSLKDKCPKHIKMFPITTLKDLKELEENISEENEKEYISSIRAITGNRGLKKGLSDIVSPKVLVDFNVDGSHNKERFLNYPRLVNVLFHGTFDENLTEKSFKTHLRDAIKLAKNRFFKEKD